MKPQNWKNHLQPGDEITWNDPDEGLCSKTQTISFIEYKDNDIVFIRFIDGSELECFLSEIS
jgi:hypothetical protein